MSACKKAFASEGFSLAYQILTAITKATVGKRWITTQLNPVFQFNRIGHPWISRARIQKHHDFWRAIDAGLQYQTFARRTQCTRFLQANVPTHIAGNQAVAVDIFLILLFYKINDNNWNLNEHKKTWQICVCQV